MADLNETRDEEWEEGEDVVESFDGAEADNVMRFSDFIEQDVKKMHKQRITELRRRAEERQDWKRISHEYDWDFDEDGLLEEA